MHAGQNLCHVFNFFVYYVSKSLSCIMLHDSSYRSVLMYRPAIGTVRPDISTHGMVGCIDRLVCTTYTNPLLDQYIPSVLNDMPWYDEPCYAISYLTLSYLVYWHYGKSVLSYRFPYYIGSFYEERLFVWSWMKPLVKIFYALNMVLLFICVFTITFLGADLDLLGILSLKPLWVLKKVCLGVLCSRVCRHWF